MRLLPGLRALLLVAAAGHAAAYSPSLVNKPRTLLARSARARPSATPTSLRSSLAPRPDLASSAAPQDDSYPTVSANGAPASNALLAWLFKFVVSKRSLLSEGLESHVRGTADGSSMIRLRADRVRFRGLSVSGGALVDLRAGPEGLTSALVWRRTPCDVRAKFKLTEGDLERSPVITRIISMLVNNYLAQVLPPDFRDPQGGAVDVAFRSITIDGSTVLVHGVVATAVVPAIPFVVSTSVVVRGGGHVVGLWQPQVQLFAGMPRLQELYPQVQLTLPIARSLDVDIGDSACIERFDVIDGVVRIEARATLTALAPFRVAPPQKRAMYACDLGALISAIVLRTGGAAGPVALLLLPARFVLVPLAQVANTLASLPNWCRGIFSSAAR